MISVEELTRGCQGQFFKAADRPVDPTILDEVPAHDTREWCAFSRHEVHEQLVKRPGNSAPGLDHVSWRALKYAARDPDILDSLATFYTALLDQGVWPRVFKTNACIVLSKPNKPDYTKLKAYRPIVLIYVLAKLGKALCAAHIQFACVKHSLLHPTQCGSTRAHCTEDAGVLLVNHIRAARKRRWVTSCLAVDIEQFFPSVNHAILIGTMRRLGFPEPLLKFMDSYLRDRMVRFRFDNTLTDAVPDPVGVGQGSVC